MKFRYESFGGIVASENPPSLVFVDKDFARNLGRDTSPLWDKKDQALLSGPVEAHFALTNYCASNCPGCYMASMPEQNLTEDPKKDLERAKSIARTLSKMGVFHVALGGGESFYLPWLFEISEYIKSLGMIPNLTTNGQLMDRETAEKCRVFGQVNVSMDAVGEKFNQTRPFASFKKADEALSLLKKAGIRAGINCVVTRKSFDYLHEVLAYARKKGLVDVELLRFKPKGRGMDVYEDMRLTKKQAREFFPRLKKLAKKTRVRIKLDCSFTPFICYHKPDKRVMDFFSIMGCEAGNWLIGVNPEGRAVPCSFLEKPEIEINNLSGNWSKKELISEFRSMGNSVKGICRECDYFIPCKGGCRQVAIFLTGKTDAPDPECPFVEKSGGGI